MITRIFKFRRGIAVTLAVGTGGVALLAGGAFFVWAKVYIPHSRHKAEARWAAMGRPMSDFEKRLMPVEENESLRALTRELRPFGVVTFYKAPAGEQSPNTFSIPKEITDLVDGSNPQMADQVETTAQRLSYLNEHRDDLDRLYRGILQREPAVWSFVPQDGMTFNDHWWLRLPSYLVARNVSQLIAVDALGKLEHGDENGAVDAIAAGLKMTSNIDEQRIVFSQMIRAATEGLFAQIIALLPEDPAALKLLATEVEARREKWRDALQWETWAAMRLADYMELNPEDFRKLYRSASLLQRIKISYAQSFLQGKISRVVSCLADQVAISEEIRELASSDLGVGRMREACVRYDANADWSKSWVRLNGVLLLREQAELIRSARAQVQAGKSGNLGELESVVIPGAKWRVIGDAAVTSVSLKLTPIPVWTTNTDVLGKEFFLLPLDGSKWWKFRPSSGANRVVSHGVLSSTTSSR